MSREKACLASILKLSIKVVMSKFMLISSCQARFLSKILAAYLKHQIFAGKSVKKFWFPGGIPPCNLLHFNLCVLNFDREASGTLRW